MSRLWGRFNCNLRIALSGHTTSIIRRRGRHAIKHTDPSNTGHPTEIWENAQRRYAPVGMGQYHKIVLSLEAAQSCENLRWVCYSAPYEQHTATKPQGCGYLVSMGLVFPYGDVVCAKMVK